MENKWEREGNEKGSRQEFTVKLLNTTVDIQGLLNLYCIVLHCIILYSLLFIVLST